MQCWIWNTYRQELLAGVGGLGKTQPRYRQGLHHVSRGRPDGAVTSMKRPAIS